MRTLGDIALMAGLMAGAGVAAGAVWLLVWLTWEVATKGCFINR